MRDEGAERVRAPSYLNYTHVRTHERALDLGATSSGGRHERIHGATTRAEVAPSPPHDVMSERVACTTRSTETRSRRERGRSGHTTHTQHAGGARAHPPTHSTHTRNHTRTRHPFRRLRRRGRGRQAPGSALLTCSPTYLVIDDVKPNQAWTCRLPKKEASRWQQQSRSARCGRRQLQRRIATYVRPVRAGARPIHCRGRCAAAADSEAAHASQHRQCLLGCPQPPTG